MSSRAFEPTFVTTFPVSRNRADIVGAVAAVSSGIASDAVKSSIAAIELNIADGETHRRRGEYRAALNNFESARASIYRLLYPGFDISQYLVSERSILPVSQALETSLMAVAGQIVTVLPRAASAAGGTLWESSAPPIEENVSFFMSVGLRDGDAPLAHAANERAVALLTTGRPAAALMVLDAAEQDVDGSAKAAMELTRSGALLQIGKASAAVEAAKAAQEEFRSGRDDVGVAQALHLQGVAMKEAGDPEGEEMLGRAAELVRESPEPTASSFGPAPTASLALNVVTNPNSFESGSAGSLQALSPQISDRVSHDVSSLAPITQRDDRSITYRLQGRNSGWGALPLMTNAQRSAAARPWRLEVVAGATPASFAMGDMQAISQQDISDKIYTRRKSAITASDLIWSIGDYYSTTVYLNHLYSYALPVAIGDCYGAQQLFAKAEQYYLMAAAYSAINVAIEGTALWIRLARNAVAWGDSLYKNEDLPSAQLQYGKVITADGAAPGSFLYTLPALADAGAIAAGFIANISVRPIAFDDWEIDAIIIDAFRQQLQIKAGLDFYGLLLAPIHTFDYLQSVAQGFAREAIEAESQFISFKTRQAAEEASRRELEAAKAAAKAESEARRLAFVAAQQDEKAATDALDLATQRVTDAQDQRDLYETTSTAEIFDRAASQELAGGQDASRSELAELAAKLDRGETIKGPPAKLAAVEVLRAGRKTQEYELAKMQDNIDELVKAKTLAADQLASCTTRVQADELAWQSAQKRVELAAAALQAFDSQMFTPDSWAKMAGTMRDIAQGYLFRGIRLAKLMERAYNFEYDAELSLIRNDYGIAAANHDAPGAAPVLGGELLLSDVESFIYSAVTTRTRKSCRIKDVISVASLFPAQFQAFRETGRLTFETDLYEFDRMHPGFCCQKIHAVELEVIGLLPESGLNGDFTAGGVTSFRKRDGSEGKRVQIVDTMALSHYAVRPDGIVFTPETGIKGLFQGFGVGATWELHAPRRSNDLDFRRIFDVRLILYYTAEFEPSLEATILAAPPRPGELAQIRDFGLRYDFPDAWYGFYADGTAIIKLERLRLPFNETNFKTRAVNLRVVTKDGISAEGITLEVTAPSGASGSAQTNANGVVTTADPGLSALAGLDPVGDWTVQVTGGASLLDGAAVQYKRVYNIQLSLDYSFDFVPEA